MVRLCILFNSAQDESMCYLIDLTDDWNWGPGEHCLDGSHGKIHNAKQIPLPTSKPKNHYTIARATANPKSNAKHKQHTAKQASTYIVADSKSNQD